MARSVNQLQLKDFGKPYFVEYLLEDEESFSVQAKFGAILDSGFDRSRSATVQVRLGNYDFDNTNLFTTGSLAQGIPLVQDDDYDAIRHDLWLLTDAIYKSSIEQMASKRAHLKNNTGDDDKLPDLSREKPTVSLQDRQKLQVDAKKWEDFVRNLSNVFRKYPEITDSTVAFYARLQNKYLVNNEGTRIRVPSLLLTLNIYAESNTPDGLRITPSRHIFARSFDKLPSEQELTKAAETLAENLTGIRKAPAFNEVYIGPALFTERAAVQVFSQLIAPNLGIERNTLASMGASEGSFDERMNRRILPSTITVVDDPTRKEIDGYPLIGGFEIDEQGVPAKPMTIVENGILKNLLSSRVPTKLYPQSNGRARSNFGSPFISNLIVEAKGGKSFAELKKELIDLCKAQNMPFGILFREVDSTFSASGRSLAPPILAYKVYVDDGREELFRTASIDAFPIRELRQIAGVGNDHFTLNHLNGNGHNGDGIPYSVTAPSLLMDEIVLRKDTSTKSKPLILSHPFFDKK